PTGPTAAPRRLGRCDRRLSHRPDGRGYFTTCATRVINVSRAVTAAVGGSVMGVEEVEDRVGGGIRPAPACCGPHGVAGPVVGAADDRVQHDLAAARTAPKRVRLDARGRLVLGRRGGAARGTGVRR